MNMTVRSILSVAFGFLSATAVSAGLPADYEPVECVWGSPSTEPEKLCYVDTGVLPSGAIPEVWLKCKLRLITENVYAFGVWNGSQGTAFGTMDGQFRYRVAAVVGLYGKRDENVHELKLNTAEGTIIDGTNVGDPKQAPDPENKQSYYLLGRNHSTMDTGVNPGDCAVYYAKIWLTKNGVRTLVRDFSACRRLKDGTGGFWDSVEGKFYPNSNPREGAPALATGAPLAETYYVLPEQDAAHWKGQTDGPCPEIRLASTGAVLVKDVDYELAWMLDDSAKKGYVLVTGKGDHLGHNAAVPYDVSFNSAEYDATFDTLDYLEAGGAAYIRTGVVPNGHEPAVRITYRNKSVNGTFEDADMKEMVDSSEKEYCLFLNNYENQGAQPTPCRIYGTKIWLDGALVRDFVPSRMKTSGMLGMFDKVEGRFYANAGTGRFRYYRPLKYVESSGVQYVKTGITPAVGDVPSVELKFQFVRFTDVVTILGYWNDSFGTYVGTINTDDGLVFRQHTGKVGGNYDQAGDPRPDGNVHVWQFNTRSGSLLDGVLKTGEAFTNVKEPSGCTEYYLFARDGFWKGVHDMEAASASRVYSCRIWLNDKLVSDLVPVSRDDGVAGLYDEVRRIFLRSSANVDLIGGPKARKSGLAVLIR